MTSVVGDQPPIPNIERDRCSIVGALDALGDVWSVLVLRQLFFGVHRFNEIQDGLGISRSVLTDRLNGLVELGVIKTVPYQEPGHRVRNEYRMTRKGVGLLPVVVALMQWGDAHVNGGEPPVALFDKSTGDKVKLELRTDAGPIEPNHIIPREIHTG
ncbi:MAG: winged helix-turn-helix transcriptional regulator [Ilumatobacteraceae bacterium]